MCLGWRRRAQQGIHRGQMQALPSNSLIPKALHSEMLGPQGTSEITSFPNTPF